MSAHRLPNFSGISVAEFEVWVAGPGSEPFRSCLNYDQNAVALNCAPPSNLGHATVHATDAQSAAKPTCRQCREDAAMLYLRNQPRQAPAAVYMYCRRDYPVKRMWPVGKPNSHTYVLKQAASGISTHQHRKIRVNGRLPLKQFHCVLEEVVHILADSFVLPAFPNLTHLQIFHWIDVQNASETQTREFYSAFGALPRLTHLALPSSINNNHTPILCFLLDVCKSLCAFVILHPPPPEEILFLADNDVRFVMHKVNFDYSVTDWTRGVMTGTDYWALRTGSSPCGRLGS
ncbi:hypothetical protein B0H13DRAFT_1923280 [Mycena leptocephala]|nr:hypothetical protein B0H13DRAFT_1923280 [Mycena leptocephala]